MPIMRLQYTSTQPLRARVLIDDVLDQITTLPASQEVRQAEIRSTIAGTVLRVQFATDQQTLFTVF